MCLGLLFIFVFQFAWADDFVQINFGGERSGDERTVFTDNLYANYAKWLVENYFTGYNQNFTLQFLVTFLDFGAHIDKAVFFVSISKNGASVNHLNSDDDDFVEMYSFIKDWYANNVFKRAPTSANPGFADLCACQFGDQFVNKLNDFTFVQNPNMHSLLVFNSKFNTNKLSGLNEVMNQLFEYEKNVIGENSVSCDKIISVIIE